MSAGGFVIVEIVLVHDAVMSVSVGERYVVSRCFYFYLYPAWESEGSAIRSRWMMNPGKGVKGSIGDRGWGYSGCGIRARLVTGSDGCGNSARGVERWRGFRGCNVRRFLPKRPWGWVVCGIGGRTEQVRRFLLKRPRGWVVGGIGARTVWCRCGQMLELRLARFVDW
jgi:hypothetical protein